MDTVSPDASGSPDRTAPLAPAAPTTTLAAVREYQHDRFGGLKPGAALFGWLVAVGLGVLLGALATVVVRQAGFGPGTGLVEDPAFSLTGGITAAVVVLLAYLCGGYVAGRLARFDGARNGVAVWILGVAVTAAVAIATSFTGSSEASETFSTVLRVPGLAQTAPLSVADILALVVVAAIALVGAVVGGKAGERYHRRLDRAAATAL